MKKKLFAALLSVSLIAVSLLGCSSSGSTSSEAGEASAGTTTAADAAAPGGTATAADAAAHGGTASAEGTAASAEAGTIALKIWVEEDNFDNVAKMIESFKKEYAGQGTFEITLEAQSDSQTRNTLLGDVHNGADVFSMPDDQLFSMIAGGAISPVIDADTIKNANLEEAVKAASYKDKLYAYPYSADNGYFLYYDKNYFTEEDVKSLDRILEIAAQAEKKFSMEFDSGWYLYSFFGNTGLEFGINDDGVTNYCDWNSTENAVKGVDVTEALLNIASHPGFLSQPNGSFIESIQSGEVIAGISGVWHAMSVKEVWGNDYGACKLPTYTCAGQQIQMASFTGYKMMGVNTYSKHLEWAHKLAAWITNEENQTLRFVERNQGPSNKNAAASDAVKKVPAITAVIAQSQYGTLQRVGNSYWDACTKYATTIMNGNPNNVPLQELIDTLANDISASTVR